MLQEPWTIEPRRVLPLMVIRRVELAAFIQVAVTYVIIEDLAAVLSEAADPAPGHAPIGAK